MALGLRHINKFTGILSFRSCIVSTDRIHKKISTTHNEQYSTRISLDFSPSENRSSGLCCNHADNRENVHDLVMKENIYYRDELDHIYIRFADLESNVNNKVRFKESSDTKPNKPSKEKLAHVHSELARSLPQIFVKTLEYSMYHPDIIFEDHIRNIRTVGLYSYMRQVTLLRMIGHFKFAFVNFEILKITQHPEDSTVKVRWRIRGISALKLVSLFWKHRLWKISEMFDKTESWYDGFSTFYVNGEGLIVKHVADKMMPDSDQVTDPSKSIENIAKLALIVGILPKFSEFNSMV